MQNTLSARTVSRVVDTFLRTGHSSAHKVRLVLEPGNWEAYDPFLLLAEDWFVPGTFGDHPHRGFETVTLVLEGELEHRDNKGGHGILRPGDAQWMTAGRGVIHAEEPHGPNVHTLQLWINLPASLKMTEPRYQDLRADELPLREEPGARLRVYAGSSGKVRASTKTHVPITMVDFRLDAGATVSQDLPSSYNAFVYVVSGKGRFGAAKTPVREGQVVWFSRGDGEPQSEIVVSADSDLHAVLWAGEPLREPVVAHGPFVMNTESQVRQAFIDFQAGRF